MKKYIGIGVFCLFALSAIAQKEKHALFRRDYLFEQDGKYKGFPLRTHAGRNWLNGYSDHLPTVIYLMK